MLGRLHIDCTELTVYTTSVIQALQGSWCRFSSTDGKTSKILLLSEIFERGAHWNRELHRMSVRPLQCPQNPLEDDFSSVGNALSRARRPNPGALDQIRIYCRKSCFVRPSLWQHLMLFFWSRTRVDVCLERLTLMIDFWFQRCMQICPVVTTRVSFSSQVTRTHWISTKDWLNPISESIWAQAFCLVFTHWTSDFVE